VTVELKVEGLAIGYGERTVLSNLSFEVARGDIFIVMGGSGSGKSTLLRNLIGLAEPLAGHIEIGGRRLTGASPDERRAILRSFGVLFQGGALWSSMTIEDNLLLLYEQLTDLSPAAARALARVKLAQVGLAGFERAFPDQLSGGMVKRAGLARAMALDAELLFLDEPGAGLDPVTARRLDELVVELRDVLGVTVVIVTHELDSIFRIGTNSILVDPVAQTIIARGPPRELRDRATDPRVTQFLHATLAPEPP
jgi:phospholipid/cholesterol/gamma-HCH transport system ATP-binding protein